MKTSFLVGNFLRAYSSAYTYKPRGLRAERSFTPDVLEDRFAARTRRYLTKRYQYLPLLQLGIVGALAFVLTAFHLPLQSIRKVDFQPTAQVAVTVEEIMQTRQQVVPPPPPRPPVPVVVPDDTIIDDEALDLDATLDLTEPLAALPPPPPPAVEEESEPEEEDQIFVVVEDMPEIIGGWGKIAQDLKYPEIAIRAGIEGTVVVQITIDKEGNPSEPKALKSASEVLDQAAIDAVMKQRFKPGMQRNRPVRVRMAIPVHFRLQ